MVNAKAKHMDSDISESANSPNQTALAYIGKGVVHIPTSKPKEEVTDEAATVPDNDVSELEGEIAKLNEKIEALKHIAAKARKREQRWALVKRMAS